MATEYEVVIGLEVHAELLTKTKIFSGAPAEFGQDPNTLVTPVCAGMPGVLPVLNKACVEAGIKLGLALEAKVAEETKFDRKHYFYPDLPKAYQISQFDKPIVEGGHIDIEIDGVVKRIGVTRAHLEEDAGKLVHQGAAGLAGSTHSLVDLNRAGVPLLEIVSQPDIRSAEEAKAYLQELRNILVYLGINDGRMEQGSLRCDANISVRPKGQAAFGTRAEVKNMNSFMAVERAIKHEVARQIDLVENGEKVVQETRLWNEEKQITISMRGKEGAADYRYFPEPDLPVLFISREEVERVRALLPELPKAKRARYVGLGLPPADAVTLANDPAVAAFFDAALAVHPANPKGVCNWVIGELAAVTNAEKLNITDLKVKPEDLGTLVKLIDEGTLTGKIAKQVLPEMLASGEGPEAIVDRLGLKPIGDASELKGIVEKVLDESGKQVAEYLEGKTKVLGFLTGQVMKATGGRAKPDMINPLLIEGLEARRQ